MSAPPPWLTGRVDIEQLRTLLGQQTESVWLDYKSSSDLSQTRDLVELAKDIGAMSMLGGYLVIGAGDAGQPAGQPPRLDLFDQARLFAKIKKYLPDADLHVGRHSLDGQEYAAVHVAPHPDGFAIFAANGQYPDRKQPSGMKEVFRQGEVFARHGTASERWAQPDVIRIKEQLRHAADVIQRQTGRGRDAQTRLAERLERAWTAWLVVVVVPARGGTTGSLAAAVPAADQLAADWTRQTLPTDSGWLPPQLYSGVDAGPRVVLDADLHTGRPASQLRVELYPDGTATAGLVVGRAARAVQPSCAVLADRVEIELVNLLDLCARQLHATGAGGDLATRVALLPALDDDAEPVPTVLTDDDQPGVPPRPLAAHAGPLLEETASDAPCSVADLSDPHGLVTVAHQLAGGLLAAAGRGTPRLLQPDGTLDLTWSPLSWRRPLQGAAQRRGLLSPGSTLL